LILGAVGGGGYYIFKNMNKEDTPAQEGAAEVKAYTPADIETVRISEGITTNLAMSKGSSKSHMVQFNFSVGINKTVKKQSQAMIDLVTSKEDVIKHLAIDIISKKTPEEINNPNSRENFAKELLERLQNEFDTDLILDIYIFDWKVV
jgi:flagellar basal body-associated protein FliL